MKGDVFIWFPEKPDTDREFVHLILKNMLQGERSHEKVNGRQLIPLRTDRT